jgi:hypothetical protein
VTIGSGPDGVGWDPIDKVVATSDQGDGAISLIANSGSGARTAIPLGTETGNVVFYAGRGQFWITAVKASPPDQLIEIDPKSNTVTTSIALPGCSGAHGLPRRREPGTTLVGHDSPGANSHSVAADPATHRVFFPLTSGPVLHIMKPGGR